jgi:hypothetical protein
MEYLAIALRLLSGTVGGLLLYAAIFTYTNERDQLQDKLVDVWVRIGEMQSKAISKHTAFMRVVADLTSKLFDFVFGKKLFSYQALLVSGFYASASECFYLSLSDMHYMGVETRVSFIFGGAVGLAMGVFYAVIAKKDRDICRSVFWKIFPVLFLAACYSLYNYAPSDPLSAALTTLLPSFFSDLLFISFTRYVLRRCKALESFGAIILLLIANITLAIVLVIGPYEIVQSDLLYLIGIHLRKR